MKKKGEKLELRSEKGRQDESFSALDEAFRPGFSRRSNCETTCFATDSLPEDLRSSLPTIEEIEAELAGAVWDEMEGEG